VRTTQPQPSGVAAAGDESLEGVDTSAIVPARDEQACRQRPADATLNFVSPSDTPPNTPPDPPDPSSNTPTTSDPTVLWRMSRGRHTAHATVFPGAERVAVSWFFDGQMDRAENYDTLDLALARADHIRSILVKDGWHDV